MTLLSAKNKRDLFLLSFFLKKFSPLCANPTKWSNTLNCFSVFEHFVGLALKGSMPVDYIATDYCIKYY